MAKLQLSVAIGDYDRMRPLVDGAVQIDAVDPQFMVLEPEEIFFRAIRHLNALDVRFEFECYDTSHLYNLRHFLDRGLVKPPLFIQTVFGILGGIGTHPEDVAHMRRTADRLFGDKYRWSVLAAGRHQMQIAAMAAAMGGNVRVGLEDSLWKGAGQLATNAEQVQLARQIIEGMGLSAATPDEAREILQLKGKDKVNI